MLRRALLPLAIVLLLPGPAHGAGPLALRADSGQRGWVRLSVSGPAGAAVTVSEGTRTVARLTLGDRPAVLPHAARWTCTRARRFTTDDGTTTAHATYVTPSCRTRLALSGPRVARAGHVARFVVRDTWRAGGFRGRLCFRSTSGPAGCRAVRPGTHGEAVARRFWRRGAWRLVLRTRQGPERARLLHVHRIPHLRVLAAGDSMVQIVDDFLRARVRPAGAGVRFDDHISTGLSKPFLLDWPRHAAAVARSYRPDVTVMFIGANDGFPFGRAGCCGPAWVRAYAAKARGMMRSYERRGAGRVYWLTLPTPRGGAFRRIFGAVDRAVRRAARGLGDVRIVDTGRVISPGGVFRPSVRQRDGVHLNVRGAAIVAGLVVSALRRDGLL